MTLIEEKILSSNHVIVFKKAKWKTESSLQVGFFIMVCNDACAERNGKKKRSVIIGRKSSTKKVKE